MMNSRKICRQIVTNVHISQLEALLIRRVITMCYVGSHMPKLHKIQEAILSILSWSQKENGSLKLFRWNVLYIFSCACKWLNGRATSTWLMSGGFERLEEIFERMEFSASTVAFLNSGDLVTVTCLLSQ